MFDLAFVGSPPLRPKVDKAGSLFDFNKKVVAHLASLKVGFIVSQQHTCLNNRCVRIFCFSWSVIPGAAYLRESAEGRGISELMIFFTPAFSCHSCQSCLHRDLLLLFIPCWRLNLGKNPLRVWKIWEMLLFPLDDIVHSFLSRCPVFPWFQSQISHSKLNFNFLGCNLCPTALVGAV